jgi:hypothetical protein
MPRAVSHKSWTRFQGAGQEQTTPMMCPKACHLACRLRAEFGGFQRSSTERRTVNIAEMLRTLMSHKTRICSTYGTSLPSGHTLGGVPERLKGPVLKTGVALVVTVGSNPTPTA